jgi:HPt (histidine-containing phosphotransfer) domain-containing protein
LVGIDRTGGGRPGVYRQPHLILCDINMPDMDSFKLKLKSLQQLLQKWLGEPLPPPRIASRSLEHSFRRQLHLRQGGRNTGRTAQEALPILDERVIKDELGDDPQLFREILDEFRVSLESGLAGLEQALHARELLPVRDAAHKLKSACSTAPWVPRAWQHCVSRWSRPRTGRTGMVSIALPLISYPAHASCVNAQGSIAEVQARLYARLTGAL